MIESFRRNWGSRAVLSGCLALGMLCVGAGAAQAQGGKLSTKELAQRKALISSIKLKLPPRAKGPDTPRPTPKMENEAYVIDAELLAVTENLPIEQRMDVQDSVLFATWAANAKYDPETQAAQWYKFYREVMTSLGWLPTRLEFQQYQSRGTKFTVDAEVIQVLAAVCTGPENALIQTAVKAFKQLNRNNSAFTLFERTSYKAKNGS